MTRYTGDTSTGRRVGLAAISCVLFVYGIFRATTAYGFWGSWLVGALATAVGGFGFTKVARSESSRHGRTRLPLWVLALGGVTAFGTVILVGVDAVCDDETGFSCGG